MPETGNNYNTRECTLSIQADLNGFSFCVFDNNGNCHVLKQYAYSIADYNDLDNEVHKLFRQEKLLQQPYKKCYCLFISNKSTLIPAQLFDVQHLRTYLDFVAPLDELDEIHFRQLSVPDAIAVFAVPSPVAAAVHLYQPNTLFLHQSIPLIYLLDDIRPHNGIIVHLSQDITSITLYAGGRLVLNNTFNVHAFADTLYYLSYVLRQWELSPQNTPVYFTGKLSGTEEKLIQQYYPNVTRLKSKSIAFAFGMASGMDYHLLQQLSICE